MVHWAVGAFEGFKQRKGVVRFAPMAALWRLEDSESGLGLSSITVLPACGAQFPGQWPPYSFLACLF